MAAAKAKVTAAGTKKRAGGRKALAPSKESRGLSAADIALPIDDERIARMFEVLRSAAAYHQVIVFTCRSTTFAPLGGARLTLEP